MHTFRGCLTIFNVILLPEGFVNSPEGFVNLPEGFVKSSERFVISFFGALNSLGGVLTSLGKGEKSERGYLNFQDLGQRMT